MLRTLRIIVLICSLALVASALPAIAEQNADDHTDNMKLLINIPKQNADVTQSDLAFWGNLMVAGNYDGFRLFNIKNREKPKLITEVYCPASQNDVSIWKNIVVASIDGPRTKKNCASESNGTIEGIRIFSIKDRHVPKLLKFVETECGSHTNTLLPGAKKAGRVRNLYIYISSYCGEWVNISIVKIPLAAPQKAKVVSTPDVSPPTGCHDITVFVSLKIAGAACKNEGQIWDISDPANPVITDHISNPANRFFHSATFTWDGKYVAFGDETLGGTGPACPIDSTPLGGIWFYEVAAPTAPLGVWYVPRGQEDSNCTAHNMNFIPVAEQYLLVAGNYSAGTSVVDFTDPASPSEIAYYDAADPPSDVWSAYFYNGYIYANDITRGIDVFKFDDPASEQATHLPYMNPQTQMKVLFKAP